MAAYDGRTKADVIRGLFGNAEAKCKCLNEIQELGADAATHFRYSSEVSRCLKDPSHDVKGAALRALASMGPAGASDLQGVAAFLREGDVELKCGALAALGGFGSHSVAYEQDIAGFLGDQLPELRAAAACALGKMKATNQVMALRSCFKDSDPAVVSSALDGASYFGEFGAVFAADVSACLSHQDPRVRLSSVQTLTAMGEGSEKQASKVVSCLADDDGMVRHAAVSYFAKVPLGMLAFKLVEQVSVLLASSDGRAQAAAAMVLGNLQANHEILMKRLKSQNGDIPQRAKPLDIDKQKLLNLLSSQFEDEASLVLAAACVQPKLPLDMRVPACAAASTLALLHCSDAVQPMLSRVMTEKGSSRASSKEVIASFLTALGVLGEMPDSECEKIQYFLNDSSAAVRAGACLGLGGAMKGSKQYAAAVASKMTDPHPAVRGAAAVGISRMKIEGPQYSNEICKLLDDSIPAVQINAMSALGNLGERGEVFACKICKLAIDSEVSVRVAACETLSNMGSRGFAFAEEIESLLQDPYPSVRTAAQKFVAKMVDNAKPLESTALEPPVLAIKSESLDEVGRAGAGEYE